MPQPDNHTDFLELTHKYLSGNASESEIRELEDMVSGNPEYRQQFMALKKAWILSGTAQSAEVDVDRLWQQTAARLEAKPAAAIRRLDRRWMAVAASAAILVVALVAVFVLSKPDSDFVAATEKDPEKFGLQDGTEVFLNRSSRLTYSQGVQSGQRRTELSGDAFFEVQHDPQRPFVIRTRGLEIEVLGTSFYVDARESQNQVQVAVESGRVAVRSQGQEFVLGPGQMAVYQIDAGQLDTLSAATPNYLALKTNTLVFDNTLLPEVVFELNRYYGEDIRLESEGLNNCAFSSVFTGKSLETVLKVLESSFNLTATRQGEAILLRGTCAPGE